MKEKLNGEIVMRQKNDFILQAEYYEIICTLIFENHIFSINKVVFVALGIKNMEYGFRGTGKELNLLEDIEFGIRVGIQNNFNHFNIIFDNLDLLLRNNYIEINDGQIRIKSVPTYSNVTDMLHSTMIQRILNEIEKLSDVSLVRRVIDNV